MLSYVPIYQQKFINFTNHLCDSSDELSRRAGNGLVEGRLGVPVDIPSTCETL